ncbi:hypothetical protein G7Z17_g11800 [Cylindrodendrum hubeiense]|uniref:Uncharacterized protein n=1 Tax=Cylindrodendrum hubeiense TaxID=595255 RepID=A0A9P5H386_9HYPO|nr:hypothetical protein G7Z17_g11800 [Cylindrodendrum hubeiense]
MLSKATLGKATLINAIGPWDPGPGVTVAAFKAPQRPGLRAVSSFAPGLAQVYARAVPENGNPSVRYLSTLGRRLAIRPYEGQQLLVRGIHSPGPLPRVFQGPSKLVQASNRRTTREEVPLPNGSQSWDQKGLSRPPGEGREDEEEKEAWHLFPCYEASWIAGFEPSRGSCGFLEQPRGRPGT